jgi:hypothetical protein
MEFCLSHLDCGVSCFGCIRSASNIKPRQITSLTVSTAGIQPIGVLKLSVENSTSIYLWLKMFPMPYCGDFLFNLLLLILNTCSSKLSSVVILHICLFSFVMFLMKLSILSLLLVWVFLTLATAQLSGHLGPNTTRRQRSKKVCKVLDYGGVASITSDIGHRSCQLCSLQEWWKSYNPLAGSSRGKEELLQVSHKVDKFFRWIY